MRPPSGSARRTDSLQPGDVFEVPPKMIIAFSGTDGAGKSTQITRLAEVLDASGRQTRVVWFRPGYSSDVEAVKRGWRRLRGGRALKAGPSAERSRILSRPGVKRAWLAMALVDTWIQCAVKLRFWSISGEIVLCDRYLRDAELDLELEFPDLVLEQWLPWRLLRAMCPKPDVRLLLLLPSEEAQRRCELKQEPFPPSPEARQLREQAYQDLASHVDWTALDANQSLDDVHRRIIEAVENSTDLKIETESPQLSG